MWSVESIGIEYMGQQLPVDFASFASRTALESVGGDAVDVAQASSGSFVEQDECVWAKGCGLGVTTGPRGSQ